MTYISFQVQQAGTGPAKYSGPVDVARSLYREGGLRSIFKGSAATAARGGSLVLFWYIRPDPATAQNTEMIDLCDFTQLLIYLNSHGELAENCISMLRCLGRMNAGVFWTRFLN